MPPKCDSVVGLKITPGLWTWVFRIFVTICSFAGTVVVASFWLQSDKHNDERYVKKLELESSKLHEARDTAHLLEIMNMRFSRLEEKLADMNESIKRK